MCMRVIKHLESRPQTVLVVRPFVCVELNFHMAKIVYKRTVTHSCIHVVQHVKA